MEPRHLRITTLSTKGQVILPQAVRQSRAWVAGTRLVVEETADGVLLRQAPAFPPSHPDAVFASLHHEGPPVSVEDMQAALFAEARRRHARD